MACLFLSEAKSQDSVRIKTNPGDKRLPTLIKKWYFKPSSALDYTGGYTSRKVDSPQFILDVKSDNNYVFVDFTIKPSITYSRNWILQNDYLYLETKNKNQYNAFEIKQLNDTALLLKFKEVKNITEPFLCNGQIYQMTEIPALFRQGKQAFEEYMSIAFSIKKLKDKSDQDAHVEFVVNCEGEIYVPFTTEKKSELESYLLNLIKKMPKWIPATMRERPVNELKTYQFSLKNQELSIRKRI